MQVWEEDEVIPTLVLGVRKKNDFYLNTRLLDPPFSVLGPFSTSADRAGTCLGARTRTMSLSRLRRRITHADDASELHGGGAQI